MRRRLRFGLAAAVALSLVAAGCGSDDDGGGSADTEAAPAETSGGGGSAAPAGGGDEVVRLAVNPWTGSAVNANVAKAVIEEAGLGTVELVEIDENAMWPA